VTNRYLADTSGLYALLSRHEPYHTQANRFYRSLPRRSEVIVIEYVLVETMTLLRARGYSALAVQFREALGRSGVVFALLTGRGG
jgi:predicted nucleic acid-binding protein